MTIRVCLPDDHNDTTQCHPRTLAQAFPAHAQQAIEQAKRAFDWFDVLHYGALWWGALVLLYILAAIVIWATA